MMMMMMMMMMVVVEETLAARRYCGKEELGLGGGLIDSPASKEGLTLRGVVEKGLVIFWRIEADIKNKFNDVPRASF
jgi:hypothetical protein